MAFEYIVSILLIIVGIYLALGLLFALFFVWEGVEKVDQSVEGASWKFRVLLIPGMMLFWILFWNRTKE